MYVRKEANSADTLLCEVVHLSQVQQVHADDMLRVIRDRCTSLSHIRHTAINNAQLTVKDDVYLMRIKSCLFSM
jgi:hypothetical protein